MSGKLRRWYPSIPLLSRGSSAATKQVKLADRSIPTVCAESTMHLTVRPGAMIRNALPATAVLEALSIHGDVGSEDGIAELSRAGPA
ncbi:hypothetical protein [Sorangium sp. So ce542]|uniref:hypothetical protein n=1 Tax=Sorangium sp. So ce542 TaxID=3133316 RepID=UPI003F6107C9